MDGRPRLVALGLEPGEGLAQVLDLAPQGLKLSAQLAKLPGALPGLPAQIPKLGNRGRTTILSLTAPRSGDSSLKC